MKSNILIELLDVLNVKYTFRTAQNLYMEHPYRNTLYGISDMLNFYKVENVAIRVENIDDIFNIELPVVAHVFNDFVLLKKITSKSFECIWNEELLSIPYEKFKENWSGIILVPEANKNSIEPNYKENKGKVYFNNCSSFFLIISFFFLIILFSSHSSVWKGWSCLNVLFLLVGILITSLLLKKQMKIQSSYADKFCSILKKSNCNSILESDAAKIFNVISWSEIGFGYFCFTLSVFLFVPDWIPYCIYYSFFALGYSVWSVFYQAIIVKQWCLMCLIVMGLFWSMFIVQLLSGAMFGIEKFMVMDLFVVGILYVVSFLLVHKYVEIKTEALLKQQLTYEMNRLKFNSNVFLSLLKESRYYNISKETSQILFGNKKSPNLISIVTNPHCSPCAKMHERLNSVLENLEERYCIQYIFSSFNESLNISGEMLISAYLNSKNQKNAMMIYNAWYRAGRYNKDAFFAQNNLFVSESVRSEFLSHIGWLKQEKLHTTPTILFNGYLLPEQYRIEDLVLLDLDSIK